MDLEISRERFPLGTQAAEFDELFERHGQEVRGKPLKVASYRYLTIEAEGRLVWIVARNDNQPIGYSAHYWYQDLNFADERVATDTLWFVLPEYRGMGIGRQMKEMGHATLKGLGALRTYDFIRGSYDHLNLMRDIGFKPWGTRWVKDLTDGNAKADRGGGDVANENGR